MGFSQENGYIPESVEQIIDWLRVKVNELFNTSYTPETFEGTNWYKMSYAWAQRMQESEIKTAEIFLKLQQYIAFIQDRISRPVNTAPGIVEKMKAEGWEASVKPVTLLDAGQISIAVDVDETKPEYPAQKETILNLISQITVGGTVTNGTETGNVVISNGQSFEYKFFLPNRIATQLRLTITESENNQNTIPSDEEIRDLLVEKISSIYRLGKNFEPQTYFTVEDAPWASQVLLEYSINGGANWSDDIYDADFDDLLTFGLEDILVILE